jgi:hypothetical protein
MPRKVFVAGEILQAADVNAQLMDQAVQVFDDSTARDAAIPSPTEGMITYLKDSDSLLTYGTAWGPAVNTASLQELSVTTSRIANANVTVDKLASNSVSTAKIVDLNVTTAKIADANVTTAKIADANVTSAKLGAGTILQVKQTVKTDVFSTASDAYTDLTDLSVTITPRSATSKILVSFYLVIGQTGDDRGYHARIMRDSTPIFVGDAAGSRVQGSYSNYNPDFREANAATAQFLDSPATTSEITYKVQVRRGTAVGAVVIGRNGTDGDAANSGRNPCSITVMEVAG